METRQNDLFRIIGQLEATVSEIKEQSKNSCVNYEKEINKIEIKIEALKKELRDHVAQDNQKKKGWYEKNILKFHFILAVVFIISVLSLFGGFDKSILSFFLDLFKFLI